MLFKTTLAAAAIAATAALSTATTAHADPSVSVSIGLGFGDFAPEPRDNYLDADPVWDDQYHYNRHRFSEVDQFGGEEFHREHRHFRYNTYYPAPRIRYGLSCSSASNVVRAAGFRGVRATDCSRPVYGYEAWKRGEIYRVNVSVAGRIVAVRPIY